MQPRPGPWSFALLVSPAATPPIVRSRGTAHVPLGIVLVVVVDGFFVVVGCAVVDVMVVVVVEETTDAVQTPIPSRRQRRMTARRQPRRVGETPQVAPHSAIVAARAVAHCARVAVAATRASPPATPEATPPRRSNPLHHPPRFRR
jgi:hypothetical protein